MLSSFKFKAQPKLNHEDYFAKETFLWGVSRMARIVGLIDRPDFKHSLLTYWLWFICRWIIALTAPITVIVHAALYNVSIGFGDSQTGMYCECIMLPVVFFGVLSGSSTARKYEDLLNEIEASVITTGYKYHNVINSACKSVIVVSANYGEHGNEVVDIKSKVRSMRWEDNSKTRFAVDSQSSTSKTVETEAENVQDTDLTGSRKGAADTNDSKISPSLPDDQGQLLFQKIVQNRLNNKGFKDYYGVIRFTIALSLIWMFVEIARYITMDPPASIDISRHVYYYVWFAGMVRFFLGDWLYFMVAFSRWFICTKRAIEQWGYHCASEILRGSQLDEQTNGKKLAPEELEDLFHIKLGIIHENWHLPLSILNQKFSYPISISYFGLVLVVLNYLMGYWPDFNGIQIAVLSATIIFLIYLTKLLGTIAETYQLAVDIFRHPTILLALQKKVGVDSSQYLMDNYLLGSDVGFKLFGTSISHSSALSFVGSFLLGFTFAFGPTLADMIIASTTS